MADEGMDSCCTICYERRENLRMLPCWHVACLTCILNMAETGQGRAVKCHECREPFLFENVRSLPHPLKCFSCHCFVRRPKQLKCCSALLCGDCITKYSRDKSCEESQCAELNSDTLCPTRCEKSKQRGGGELCTPRICCQCFTLHTNTMADCDHSICGICAITSTVQRRTCPVCSAVVGPAPLPIDPTGTRAVLVGPNNVVHDEGQAISQMHLISAIQTVRLWNQRNARQQQPNRSNYSLEQLKHDCRKVCAVGIAMGLAALGWGVTWWIWILMAFQIIILRPTVQFTVVMLGLFFIIFFLYLLFYHFILTICYFAMAGILNFVFQRLAAHARTSTARSTVGWILILSKLMMSWIFSSPIFFNFGMFDFSVLVSCVMLQLPAANA